MGDESGGAVDMVSSGGDGDVGSGVDVGCVGFGCVGNVVGCCGVCCCVGIGERVGWPRLDRLKLRRNWYREV